MTNLRALTHGFRRSQSLLVAVALLVTVATVVLCAASANAHKQIQRVTVQFTIRNASQHRLVFEGVPESRRWVRSGRWVQVPERVLDPGATMHAQAEFRPAEMGRNAWATLQYRERPGDESSAPGRGFWDEPSPARGFFLMAHDPRSITTHSLATMFEISNFRNSDLRATIQRATGEHRFETGEHTVAVEAVIQPTALEQAVKLLRNT